MSELPPNPDLMLIPQHAPELILSAEKSFSMPALARSVDIYAEHFHLDSDLEAKNKRDEPNSRLRLGLFVRSFSMAVSGRREPLRIDLGGANGTETTPNAFSGGRVSCFIQKLDQKYVDTFNIDAYGGNGYNQALNPGKETPGSSLPGGNGGNGGEISVAFGSSVSSPLILARKLISGIKQKSLKYPGGVSVLFKQLKRRCQDKDVQTISKVAEAFETLDKYPEVEETDFVLALVDLITTFAAIELHMSSRVSQSVGVRGGNGGVGLEGRSNNGKPGTDGKAVITQVSNPKSLWELGMCFAHPTQCNMMLERAKSRYYAWMPKPSDIDGKAKPSPLGEARAVLENLLDRLEFLDRDHWPSDVAKSNLVAAYKIGDATLNIPVNGKSNDSGLPTSLSQLALIREEALGLYAQMDAGLDAFGDPVKTFSVPTGSFKFYQQCVTSSLDDLRKSESLYKGYKEAADKSVENKEHIKKSREATDAALAYNASMHEDIVRQVNDTAANIARYDYPLSRAKASLIQATKQIEEELKRVMPFPFEELIAAGTQLMFVGKWPMAVLQGINLQNQVRNKITKDDGITVERKYLVRKATNIIGSLDSLKEGYKMLFDGTLKDEDEDASKLLIQEEELSKLLDEVYSLLKSQTVQRVKTLFKFYITLVVQRGADIMRYNALISTLARYKTESESLRQRSEELKLEDIASVNIHHPIIVSFMQKLYVSTIRTTEYYLYKAQRAYNYAALNYDNAIGAVLGDDLPFSSFDSTVLSAAHQKLSLSYNQYLESRGSARGHFEKVQYPLDEWEHISAITDAGTDSCTFFVTIIPGKGPGGGGPDPFAGMANVRLLKARCYLQGATCTPSNMLHLTLTHYGTETLVDHTARKYEFKHKGKIVSAFKYDLETGAVRFDSTVGEDREDSGYALVGPYVTWRVDVNERYNPGMDLSGVTGGYLEFDGYFRAVSWV